MTEDEVRGMVRREAERIEVEHKRLMAEFDQGRASRNDVRAFYDLPPIDGWDGPGNSGMVPVLEPPPIERLRC